MQPIEKTIVSHFIASALDAGFTVHSVHDGEARHLMKPTHAGTTRKVLEIVDSVDESRIHFARADGSGGRETLCVALGNGEDCLYDMSEGRADWDALVASECAWADRI
jgi:hypothetical protein